MAVSIIIAVLATCLVAVGFIYALSGESAGVSDRLGRLWRPSAPEKTGIKQASGEIANKVLSGIAKYVPNKDEPSPEGDIRLIQAGFRRPEAVSAFTAARAITVVAFVFLTFVTGLASNNPVIMLVVAGLLGYLLPDIWLSRKIKARQMTLRLALPDALDLLVICMEAGLGIDQAILYVSQELRTAHPEICDEFDLVNAEMHVGKTRIDALRSLATRTGVDDIQALVSTLIQTDRFGTSVAQSMRVHSDELRTRRRQRAEEMAAKTTIKMIIPLVLFIFPALFVVLLGPAVLKMMQTFGNK
jgi:tight adherence protein C